MRRERGIEERRKGSTSFAELYWRRNDCGAVLPPRDKIEVGYFRYLF